MNKNSRNTFRLFRFDVFLISIVLGSLLLVPQAYCAQERQHSSSAHDEARYGAGAMVDLPDQGTSVEVPGEMTRQSPEMTVQLTPEMLKLSDVKTAPVDYRYLERKSRPLVKSSTLRDE